MKKRSIVSMLLITIVLSAMGCAQKAVVKKDEGIAPQKTAESKKEVPAQASTATTPSATAQPILVAPSVSSADSQQKSSAQQIALATLYFGYDSHILTNESRNTLQANFKALEGRPSIRIEGHCDERGSSEYNLALGEKRAQAAQNYLVTLGYPAGKISTISFGKERPADKGNDEIAWAKNRRDEFKIVK